MKFSHNDQYANLLPRAMANMTDGAILMVPFMFALWRVSLVETSQEIWAETMPMLAFVVIPGAMLSILYGPYTLSRWGKTIGKAIVGIKVTTLTKDLLTFKLAIFRELMAKAVSGGAFGLGFLAVLTHPEHRAWHDELTGTVVSVEENRWWMGLLTIVVLWTVYGYVGFQSVLRLVELFK